MDSASSGRTPIIDLYYYMRAQLTHMLKMKIQLYYRSLLPAEIES
jgi:hypothetical protein